MKTLGRLCAIGMLASMFFSGCTQEAPWTPIVVNNADFSLPAVGSSTVLSFLIDDWQFDGGRVHLGGRLAAFGDRHGSGESNGLSQVLDHVYVPGEYRLKVTAGVWNLELASRIILGYVEDTIFVTLGQDDLTLSATSSPDYWVGTLYWQTQLLTITVDSASPAIGKQLFMRLTGIVDGSDPDNPSYQSQYNLWDEVQLFTRAGVM